MRGGFGHDGRWPEILRSDAARRIGWILLVALLVFLWLNMVRRAMDGDGSQYDDFVAFSRDLLYSRVDVYALYPEWNTIVKYPPFFAFLMAPFAPLPTWLGATAWFWLSLAMAVATTWLAVRLADDGRAGRPLTAGFYVWPFVAAAGVIGSNLETAQVNIAILFLVVWGLAFFRIRQDGLSGAIVGVAVAVKLTAGVFLLYFLWKRAWRAALGVVAGLVVCWLVLQPLAFGPGFFVEITKGWWADLRPFLEKGVIAEGVGGYRHTNQSLAAVVGRFFTAVPAGGGREDLYLNVVSLDREAARWIVRGLQATTLVVLAGVCRTPTDDRRRIGLAFEYALVLIATLFLSPISWINHYVVLLPAFAAAIYWIRTRPRGPARRLLLGTVIVAAVLLASGISVLAQALSLPFFGAVALFTALAVALHRERGSAWQGSA